MVLSLAGPAAHGATSACGQAFYSTVNLASKVVMGPKRSLRGLLIATAVIATPLGLSDRMRTVSDQLAHTTQTGIESVSMHEDDKYVTLTAQQWHQAGSLFRKRASSFYEDPLLGSAFGKAPGSIDSLSYGRALRNLDFSTHGTLAAAMERRGLDPRVITDESYAGGISSYIPTGSRTTTYLHPWRLSRMEAFETAIGETLDVKWQQMRQERDWYYLRFHPYDMDSLVSDILFSSGYDRVERGDDDFDIADIEGEEDLQAVAQTMGKSILGSEAIGIDEFITSFQRFAFPEYNGTPEQHQTVSVKPEYIPGKPSDMWPVLSVHRTIGGERVTTEILEPEMKARYVQALTEHLRPHFGGKNPQALKVMVEGRAYRFTRFDELCFFLLYVGDAPHEISAE